MKFKTNARLGWGLFIGIITPLIVPNIAEGASLRTPNLRTPMPGEGYLSFQHDRPFMGTIQGEERTGWTDIRHPSLDGKVDMIRGYDWSDNQVMVLTHNVNAPGGNSTVNKDLRRQDFDVANAIYAQAGITVLQEGNMTINGNDIVNAPSPPQNNTQPSLSMLFGNNRSANAKTINQYYVDDIPGAFGQTLFPSNPPDLNNGFAVADNKRIATFAHELGHFLLDNNRFSLGGEVHSSLIDDVMKARKTAADTDRIDPSLTPKVVDPMLGAFGLKDPGLHVRNIGTTSHFGENVTPLGGATPISQIEAIYKSPSVQRTDNGKTYGDRADFDWVEDNKFLEAQTTTGDNHKIPTPDALYWTTNPTAASTHTGHNHDNWGALNLGNFKGGTFNVVDVVSQIARYTDMDVDASGNWSDRESALDYIISFSEDSKNWVEGVCKKVFDDGWIMASRAEDYVARWSSSVAAKFVKIEAKPLSGNNDGNTQIDAIIAANIPERMSQTPDKPKIKDRGAKSVEFTGTNTLNFSDLTVTDALLDNQIPSLNDPILGGNILIGSTNLLGEDPGNGWFFDDSTYQIVVGGIPVLTADLVNNFLFAGGGVMPGFDSEFQGTFQNIQINNTINSPYLDTLQSQINSPRFVSVFSNILAATNNFTTLGSSETVVMDGGKSVPEPSSIFGIFAIGGLGLIGLRKKR